MPYLSDNDKLQFLQEGYLVLPDVISPEMIAETRDALWAGIRADRDNPATWINAEPRMPVTPEHPAMQAVVNDSPVFGIAEELAGPGTLRPCGAEPALIYPSGKDDWVLPPEGHLDGYYMPSNGVPFGTVDRFMLAVTIYVDDVGHRGAGFIVYPRSHLAAMAYFKSHALLSIQSSSPREAFEVESATEITGPAGTVCFWHGQLVHHGSDNATDRIRMALISRFRRWDMHKLLFETPEDDWASWEGCRGLIARP